MPDGPPQTLPPDFFGKGTTAPPDTLPPDFFTKATVELSKPKPAPDDSGFSKATQKERQHIREVAPNVIGSGSFERGVRVALPVAGAMIGSMAGPEGSILGRAATSGLGALITSPMGQKAAGEKVTAGKTAEDVMYYGVAPELVGGVLIKAGEKLAPTAIKKLATTLFKGRMDVAGQAIDQYLAQPALQGIKVDAATPINDMLDKEIERNTKIGAKSLADRLEQLKLDWNKSYNLKNPTLSELNAFKRDLAKATSFAGEANKVTLNQLQKRTTGIVADLIEKAAPGVKPLNEAYADLAGGAKAARSSARKSTSGFTGLGLSMASHGLKSTGKVTPDILRSLAAFLEDSGSPAAVPSN